MANGGRETHRHFILEGVTETERYRSRGGGSSRVVIPQEDRPEHAARLRAGLSEVHAAASRLALEAEEPVEGFGVQVEFEGFPDLELAFEKLPRETQGIELRNVRVRGKTTLANVFVPTGKLDHFEKLIRDYLGHKRNKNGHPIDNQKLLDTIRAIRTASVQALWTDDAEEMPEDEEPFWCEVWLAHPRNQDRDAAIRTFRERARTLGMQVVAGEVRFPERTVFVAHTSLAMIQRSVVLLNSIAELRRAKETAEFFDALTLPEQSEWMADLLERASFNGGAEQPYVCLLDTGVNRAHPLIEPALDAADLHTVEPGWGPQDDHGHGTAMAGLALAGNLTDLLVVGDRIDVDHRLESVKLLAQDGAHGDDPRHHGYLTAEAVARPEIEDASRRRVFGMAVTAKANRDRGRPSAWSATLDALASDSEAQGSNPRLLVVAAGNVEDNEDWTGYPISNDSDGIHDPAQAWNALTVGAYTNLTRITEPDMGAYTPIARPGALSPFSTTSLTWQRQGPLKPDVVFEGGNAADDGLGAVRLASLSLLTTHNRTTDRLFSTANATSAATALASRMAAQVMAAYPELWPETVRGLIVHSAEWTPAMKAAYLPDDGPQKNAYLRLIQRCGFGVPDLQRALWTLDNSLTMIVERGLQPYEKESGKDPTTRDMHLHELPWPRGALEDLGNEQVEMRVTLSYFIEPNPSHRGYSRYRYESHGLRFDVKRPTESTRSFRARVNAAAEGQGTSSSSDDPFWLIGVRNRHRGSLHSDVWRGPAVELANRANVAVFPTQGWWRLRHRLGSVNRGARYALLVSIRAPDTDIDLYTEVANQIGIAVPVGLG